MSNKRRARANQKSQYKFGAGALKSRRDKDQMKTTNRARNKVARQQRRTNRGR